MTEETSKKNSEETKEESDLEKNPKDKAEESELEEKVEISEDKINTKQFQDFIQNDFPEEMQIPESKAPVLELINSPQRNLIFRLEENLIQSTSFQENKKNENEFDYMSSGQQKNEPQYFNAQSEVIGFRNVPIENLGKNSFSQQQEIEWKSSRDDFESSNIEKYVPAKVQDIQNLGRENPFEKKEIKYSPSRNH